MRRWTLGFGSLDLELLAELARHGARPTHPATHFGHDLGQLLRSEHQQRKHHDQQQFAEADLEHRAGTRRAGADQACRSEEGPPLPGSDRPGL